MITDEKKRALQQFLSIPDEDMEELKPSQYEENGLEYGKEEYLILTDMEANARAREDIERSLWAFQPSFILSHCSTYDRMSNWEYDSAKTALEKIGSHFCEGVNELIRALISDIDEFVEDAISEDGRGHFISMYDGDENEETVDGVTYYIYRTN